MLLSRRKMLISCIHLLLLVQQPMPLVLGHGYLSSPRSRNYYANQMTKWSNPTANDPEPETEPQSLNQGTLCGATGNKDYNTPRNAVGGPMRTTIQANWTSGQEVIIEVVLTAHHKGHFVFSACPITPGTLPTHACFDKYKLTFVQDILHNANYDPHYPERAYVAPYGITRRRDKTRRDLGGSETMDTLYPKSVKYSYKMRLPSNIYGDLVLIQWHYLTANSCVHEGYAEYNWPDGWLDALDLDAGVRNADKCGKAGLGAEQFRNCAEVRIVSFEEAARAKKVVEESRLKAEEEARLARIKAEEERERLKKEDKTHLAIAEEESRLQAKEDEIAQIKAAEEEARLNSKEEKDEDDVDKRPPDVKGTSSPNDNESSGKSKRKKNKEEGKNDLKKKKKPKKNNDHESNGQKQDGDKSEDDNDKKKTENQDAKKGKKKTDYAMSKEKEKMLNDDDDRHKMKSRMRIGIKGPRRKID